MKDDSYKRYLKIKQERAVTMMALWTCKDGKKHFVGICAIGTGPNCDKVDIIDCNGWIHTVDMSELEIWN